MTIGAGIAVAGIWIAVAVIAIAAPPLTNLTASVALLATFFVCLFRP